MHLVDITMFHAAQGGGISTYLNAKAAWLASHGAGIRHTIFTPNPCATRTPSVCAIPGVALPEEQEKWAALCPDPNLILQSQWL